jgi:hypothetical protein
VGCVAALLAVLTSACAGSQPPARSPVEPGARVSGPEPTSEKLLYASTIAGHAFIFSYPHGGLVGKFTIGSGGDEVWGTCADGNGDVYFTVEKNATSSAIVEYAHGGTTPIATLGDDGYVAADCASDPTTGDLAVTSYDQGTSGADNVAVYKDARGTPKRYVDSEMSVAFCGYDAQGNLFVDGNGAYQLAELAKGAKSLKNLALAPALTRPGGVEWDGTNLAIEDSGFARRFAAIDRVQLSSSGATVLATTHLHGLANRGVTFWLDGGDVVTTAGQQDTLVGRWPYPGGGKPVKIFHAKGIRGEELYGVTISTAPTR